MEITPIKTALCSFGMSGKVFHAPFIHANAAYELYAVVERHNKVTQEIYPYIKSFNSIDEMLADTSIELVVVNTPNKTHYEYAKQALLAGKHVIVEKPFVVNAQEGEELRSLAEAKNLMLSVYQSRRWDSDFQSVKEIIDQNVLGNIVEAEIHYDRYKKELGPKVHKETPGPGAGLLYDLGSHLIDQALQLFGKPDAVFADIAIMRPASRVDDYVEIILYYKTKRVRLKTSNLVNATLPAYIILGMEGAFVKNRADVQERDLIAGKSPLDKQWGIESANDKGVLTTSKGTENIVEHIAAKQANCMAYFDSMYNAIRNNDAVPVTVGEAIEVIKVIEAALLSSKERRVIEYR